MSSVPNWPVYSEPSAATLGGVGTRDQMMSDLGDALDPEADKGTLAVFALDGYRTNPDFWARHEADALVTSVVGWLARHLGDAARLYRPRSDEVAAIILEPIEAAAERLERARMLIERSLGPLNVTLAFGATSLPDEADEPVDALILADTRLHTGALAYEAREERFSRSVATATCG